MDIGDLLVQRGLITADQRTSAVALGNGSAARLDRAVVELGYAAEEDVLEQLADELGMRYVDLTQLDVSPELLAKFPTSPLYKHVLLPLEEKAGKVYVAVSDPFDVEALQELATLTGLKLRAVLAPREQILRQIKEHLGVGGDTINELIRARGDDGVELLEELSAESGELAEQAQSASVIRLVNELLVEALNLGASDVHIEPAERGLTVRFRVDGLLRVQSVPAEINHFFAAIVTRLKIMAHLNIAEKRLPQDGRIQLRVSGREIDVRVSIIPMIHGEGIVLRLLDKQRMKFDLESAGMQEKDYKTFRELITMPHGIVLVTGPTGSGKTTTLYSALNAIKTPETKIITVEDPVEYHTQGISQIQVHSRIGLTFAAGLRSILRHDPDVVLIGEVRDSETAQSAIQASLTGHLVFSTLHTNDAPGSFTRLIDMGVEPYLVASTVEGILAQRLLRTLCKHCKQPYVPKEDDIPPEFPEPRPEVLYRAAGCRECSNTGYRGRTGIHELLKTDAVVRRLCIERADAGQIREYCLRQGMTTLRQSGFYKVADGITSIDEVMRVTRGDA
ncbi:GspE/PulE family protein [Stratiformator vulcanicus]|uniref:Type II secretion system protein E n=1 Tax=Stratiformator vulcanicus TaxID=2527980 RepID=A0A517R246_9PLAN|nr:ATPase, T2SS/T4P/T4SS family [Stratiformator vulcanicus]QDT37942.1 Type II secretion system protein E [Stratiformator vulcanicus]